LEYLGEGAYKDSGITYVKFANRNKLETIEGDTFRNCRNLKTVSFGESTNLEIIKEGAFENSKNLISVVIPESNIRLTEILERAFNNCTSLVNVTLPSSLMEIGDEAFTNSPYLESNIEELMSIGSVLMRYTGTDSIVHISSDIAAISKGAFKDNEYIREIVIEDGSQLFAIGEEAFMNCTNLESINFPSTITHIGKDAMQNTAWLNSYVDDFVVINDILIKYKGDEYQAIIPNNISTIGIEAFYGNTKLRNIEIGDSVTNIMDRAFNNMNSESSITMLGSNPPQLAQDMDIVSVIYVESNSIFNNYREDPSWERFINDPTESIIVKYEITFDLVYEDATMDFMSLETNALYTEPTPVYEGYTFIGWYEFYDSSLLPDEPGAYDSLVTMPYIPDENTTLYAKWIHNETGTIAGELRIQNFEPDDFEEGTYLVEYTAFDRHVMIPSVHSAQQIIGISKYSNGNTEYNGFRGNEYVEEISFVEGYYDGETFVDGSTIKYILEGAFENAINLRRIVLPSSLEYIGPNAFRNCQSLEEIVFSSTSSSVEIAENAFYGCSSLTTITLEENITAIGDNAFGECSSLTTIYMNGDTPPTGNQPFEINQDMRIYVNRSVDDMIVETYKSEWPLYEDYIYPKP
ncbi:MAG: leucine-rich repeat protein, partial [Bacillota bacterium]